MEKSAETTPVLPPIGSLPALTPASNSLLYIHQLKLDRLLGIGGKNQGMPQLSIQVHGKEMVIQFEAVEGQRYVLETSKNLSDWAQGELIESQHGSEKGPTQILEKRVSGGRYYRLGLR